MAQEAPAVPLAPKNKLYVIGLRNCGACDSLTEQLNQPEMQTALQEKYGTKDFEVIYGEDESESGSKAINMMSSIDKFYAPQLIVEKLPQKEGDKSRICLINEKLEEERCAVYRELPKTEEVKSNGT